MLKPIATFVTLIACAMAGVAAWDRGGNAIDRTLLVSISIIIVLAVHLLPGLSRRPATWLVWCACLVAAIYGHLTFITYASQRAALNRINESAMAVGTQQQIEVIKSTLDNIKARPISVIAAELSTTRKWRIQLALQAELAEAKRAEELKLQLAKLYATATVTKSTVVPDPVVGKLAGITGLPEAQISVAIGLMLSVLVELVGALLWFEALKDHGNNSITRAVTDEKNPVRAGVTDITTVMASITTPSADPVALVRYAIVAGRCKGTVAGIRTFLSCSQDRAMAIRREIGDLQVQNNTCANC